MVNEWWDSFAQENQGELLLASGILGRPLWEFISDMETRHIYRLLHRRVRSDGASIGISFRCDAPGRHRLLGLNISPLADECLEYRVSTIERWNVTRFRCWTASVPLRGFCKDVRLVQAGRRRRSGMARG